jgi:hypothetical protein
MSAPQRSLARTATFGLMLAAMVVGSLEGLSWLSYGILESQTFSYADVRAKRHALLAAPREEKEAERPLQRYVPHPYLGYVLNPDRFDGPQSWWIYSEGDPFRAPPDAVQVVVVGGSVAFNLRWASEPLLEAIRQIPAYRERPVRLLTLAGLGYKQPQQLLAVAYFLSLGGRIDLLVNIDGFNEIGTELDRNLREGVAPSYPSFWSQATRDLDSVSQLHDLSEIVVLRRARSSLATRFEPLRWSITANLVWLLMDRSLEKSIQRRIGTSLETEQGPTYSRGPKFAGSAQDAHRLAVRIWQEGSLALHRLATGYGFAYFHFLQPNQYVPGSKNVLTAVERDKRVVRQDLRQVVRLWYPALQKAGAELRSQGVAFFDLTPIYRDVEETIYRDSCCHFSDRGRELLAAAIGRTISKERAQATTAPAH